MAKDIVWVAEMETERFSFVGAGKTKAQAEEALVKRWNLHAKNYDLARWNQGMGQSPTVGEYYGMWVRPMRLGVGYMDSEAADDE